MTSINVNIIGVGIFVVILVLYLLCLLIYPWYRIKKSKSIDTLNDDAWYAVRHVDKVLRLVQLRLVSDSEGRLDPQSVKSEWAWYGYNSSVVQGEFITDGLLMKKKKGCEVYLYPMSYPSTNVGGVLLIWD